MTRKTSRSVRSKIGSQSNQVRPARELRSFKRQGGLRARAGLSSARMPMALTILPAKRGLALRYRRSSRSMGPLFRELVHHRTAGEGNRPRSSMLSSRVLPEATGARIRGMPAGSVARMNSTVFGHSTSPSGAWTATSRSRGTMRDSRRVIAWLSLPPLVEIATRAPARIMAAQRGGTGTSAMRLDMGRSPRRWRERPLRGPRICPAETGHCLLPRPGGRGAEGRAIGRCSGGMASQPLMARSEPQGDGAGSLRACGVRGRPHEGALAGHDEMAPSGGERGCGCRVYGGRGGRTLRGRRVQGDGPRAPGVPYRRNGDSPEPLHRRADPPSMGKPRCKTGWR